jgi:molybdenum cofactor synthesis domain-containing protein
MTTNDQSTAAVLLIGNELLSGRTQDVNLGFIAKRLAELGITLCEARVVLDIEAEIIAAVRVLSERYTYVFTTGGIGPTHDDITTAAIARAFDCGVHVHPDALSKLQQYYRSEELTPSRLKMAMVPEGSTLIDNPISSAPGFRIANVFVLAGVPPIMRAMFTALEHQLQGGAPILSRTVTAAIGESRLAEGLDAIQRAHSDINIGSYPFVRDGRATASIVLRGRDTKALDAAASEVAALMQSLGIVAAEIECR